MNNSCLFPINNIEKSGKTPGFSDMPFIEEQGISKRQTIGLQTENKSKGIENKVNQCLYRLFQDKDKVISFLQTVELDAPNGSDTDSQLAIRIENKKQLKKLIKNLAKEIDLASGEEIPSLSFLSRVENLLEISVWQNKDTGKPEKIEFSRYSIEFDIRDSKLISVNWPGYSLAQEQIIQELGDITNYLILEKEMQDEKKQKMIIFPMLPLQKTESSLETPTKIDDSSISQSQLRPHFISIELDSEGKLKLENNESRFFLAMMHLWEHRYAKALETIKACELSNGLTENEKQILKWISEMEGSNLDEHPSAFAVRSYAGALLISQYFEKEKFLTIKHLSQAKIIPYCNGLIDNYWWYLQKREYTELLSKGDEIFILNQLDRFLEHNKSDNNKEILQRRQMLMADEQTVTSQEVFFVKDYRKEPGFDLQVNDFLPCLQGEPDPSYSLLRPSLLTKGFFTYYSILKNLPLADNVATSTMLDEISGIRGDFATSGSIRDSLRSSLLFVKGNPDKMQAAAAAVLLAVLEHPEAFPKKLNFDMNTLVEIVETAKQFL